MAGNYGRRSYRNGMLDQPQAKMSEALRDHLMVLTKNQRQAHIFEWNSVRVLYPHFGPEQIDQVVTRFFTEPQPDQSSADTFDTMKEFVNFDPSPVLNTPGKKASRTSQSTSTTNMATLTSRPRANALLSSEPTLKEISLNMVGYRSDAMDFDAPFSQEELEKERTA